MAGRSSFSAGKTSLGARDYGTAIPFSYLTVCPRGFSVMSAGLLGVVTKSPGRAP